QGNIPEQDTADPVRYADGVAQIVGSDLSSDSSGMLWGQTRSWSNGPGYAGKSFNGNGWVDTELPTLLQIAAPQTLAVVSNSITARYYDLVDGSYQPRFFDQSSLAFNGSNGEYILTDSAGDQIRFNGFSASLLANQRGQFKSFTDRAGNVTQVTQY